MTDRDVRYRSRWAVAVGVVVLSAVAGWAAYHLGLRHGVATAVASSGAVPWGAFHPWGPGFGFPLLILALLWFVGFKRLAFGHRHHHWGHHHRRHCADRSGVPPAFEEWHRRAHEAAEGPKEAPPADHPDRRG